MKFNKSIIILVSLIFLSQVFTDPQLIQTAKAGEGMYDEDFSTTSYYYSSLSNCSGWGEGIISLPQQSPELLSNYNTDGFAVDVEIDGDYAYVADGNNGLMILDIDTPSSITSVANFSTSGYLVSVNINGSYAYLATNEGLVVLDISNPYSPVYVTNITDTSQDSFQDSKVIGSYILATEAFKGFRVYDASNFPTITLVEAIDNPYWDFNTKQFVTDSNYAYIASTQSGIDVISINDLSDPSRVSNYSVSESVIDIALNGNYTYTASNLRGFQVVDITNKSDLSLIENREDPARGEDIVFKDDYIYLAAQDYGLWIYNASIPENPRLVSILPTSSNFMAVDVANDYIYTAEGSNGLVIYSLDNEMDPIMNYYASSAQAVSHNIHYSAPGAYYESATLAATGEVPIGTTIELYLSPDGGSNWELVNNGTSHDFVNNGTILKWKAVLKTANPSETPLLSRVIIIFKYSKMRAPDLINPSNSFATNDSTPTFEWEHLARDWSYLFQVDDNIDFSSPEINETLLDVGSATFTPISNLPNATYYWRVAAFDYDDVLGYFSEVFTIIIGTQDVQITTTTTTPSSTTTETTTEATSEPASSETTTTSTPVTTTETSTSSSEDDSTSVSQEETTIEESITSTTSPISTSSPGFELVTVISIPLLLIIKKKK